MRISGLTKQIGPSKVGALGVSALDVAAMPGAVAHSTVSFPSEWDYEHQNTIPTIEYRKRQRLASGQCRALAETTEAERRKTSQPVIPVKPCAYLLKFWKDHERHSTSESRKAEHRRGQATSKPLAPLLAISQSLALISGCRFRLPLSRYRAERESRENGFNS